MRHLAPRLPLLARVETGLGRLSLSPTVPIAPRVRLLARAVWLALVLLTVGLTLLSFPSYLTPAVVCHAPPCENFTGLPFEREQLLNRLGLGWPLYLAFWIGVYAVDRLLWLGFGLLLFWRASDRWLVLVTSYTFILGATFPKYIHTLITQPEHDVWLGAIHRTGLPFDPVYYAGRALEYLWFFLVFLVVALLPSGRCVPRWAGWLVAGNGCVRLVYFVALDIANIGPWLQWPLSVADYVCVVGLGIAIVQRYRHHSTPVEQQQMKWLIFSLMVWAGSVFIPFTLRALVPDLESSPVGIGEDVLTEAASLFLLLAFGFAFFRYRLFAIDRIINRTVVYSLVTGILVVLYVGLVFVLQTALRGLIGQESVSAVVLATLGVATLFQPLRRRVQAAVDRRFYRRAYNAEQIARAFGAALQGESDLDDIRAQLIAVVQETVQPETVTLWLKPPREK